MSFQWQMISKWTYPASTNRYIFMLFRCCVWLLPFQCHVYLWFRAFQTVDWKIRDMELPSTVTQGATLDQRRHPSLPIRAGPWTRISVCYPLATFEIQEIPMNPRINPWNPMISHKVSLLKPSFFSLPWAPKLCAGPPHLCRRPRW